MVFVGVRCHRQGVLSFAIRGHWQVGGSGDADRGLRINRAYARFIHQDRPEPGCCVVTTGSRPEATVVETQNQPVDRTVDRSRMSFMPQDAIAGARGPGRSPWRSAAFGHA